MPNKQFTGPWVICSRCNGDGSHSHRLGAISAEQMAHDWDEEEQERYFAGGYDESCEVCEGTGKVRKAANNAERKEAQAERDARAEERYWQRLESHACGEFS